MSVSSLGLTAWRNYVTDGVPSSGAQQPLKSDIQAFVSAIGAFLDGSWTTGSIPFLSSASAFGQANADLFWNNSTKRLGVGTNSPTTGYRSQFVNGSGDTSGTLLVSTNLTDPAVEPRGLNSVLTSTFSADSAIDQLAGFGTLFVNPGTHTQSASHNAGFGGGAYGFGLGTTAVVNGLFANSGNQGPGAVTNAIDIRSRTVINSGGGTVTNYYGYYQEDSTGTTGVSNTYGIKVTHPSIFGGVATPASGFQLDVRGPLQVKQGGSSVPASSGTAYGSGMQQAWNDNSGAAMFAYGNGGSGYHLLVSDTGALGTSYDLTFQNNGGATKAGGALTSKHATAGVGYSTGAGGTVTQATDKSTGVTLNTACGAITMNAATLNAGAKASFTLTNSAIAATDTVGVSVKSGGTASAYRAAVTAVGSGSCAITVENITGGNLSEAPVITFAVTKAVTS